MFAGGGGERSQEKRGKSGKKVAFGGGGARSSVTARDPLQPHVIKQASTSTRGGTKLREAVTTTDLNTQRW